MDKYFWINTRDGSPTLWNNEVSEPFRTIKGAFTESWYVFVKNTHEFIKKEVIPHPTIGEFGLGPGTNWLIWSLTAPSIVKSYDYFVIEREPELFLDYGLKQWDKDAEKISSFLKLIGFDVSPSTIREHLKNEKLYPKIFANFEDAMKSNLRAQIWYHDPFGQEVNPEAYTSDYMQASSQLWKLPMIGCSYACNKAFKNELTALGCELFPRKSVEVGLKREHMVFEKR